MKEPFKITDEFHRTFTSTLDKIEREEVKKAPSFKGFASIAAAFVLLVTAALIGADAAGMIDLNEAFKSVFGIINDYERQQIASELTADRLPECTHNGITAKVVQSVNDVSTATVLLELTSVENNLHHDMLPRGMSVDIEGVRASYSTGTPYPSEPMTIEELMAYYAGDNSKINAEQVEKGYTNKIYLLINLNAEDPVLGRTISVRIPELITMDNDDDSGERDTLKTDLDLSWQLADGIKTRYVRLDKELDGIKIEGIELTPIGYTMTFAEPVDFNAEVPEGELDMEGRVYLHGVRYSDGTTHAINRGGGIISPEMIQGSFIDIVDIDKVTGIFIGDFTEIPFN